MFDINPGEFLVLLVLAVIIFGPDKLPRLARKAAQVFNYVRNMAGNAQSQLRKELGPEFADLDVRDLNPKAFIQKHLLDDVEPVLSDVKADLADGKALAKTAADGVREDLDAASKDFNEISKGGAGAKAALVTVPFDPEAT
ncbi:sec-independent translocase [Parenemella sanctibonifatiensis]|uniref:Translocase n=1 Tax=Parenemella sanctibonifatiensis TaxID=2016505 RepID=A0A255EJX1_9ACTN|nr:sec-independent translocase [Parenemella sanctibonifatiensis]OYN89742.1 translocase [Parenemella sanctibonifatiensis]